VCIGAILTQNTAWTNVERSIGRLKELDLLDPARISDAPASEIARAISSSGYYNQKAGYLKAFCGFLMERFCGDVEAMRGEETSILRSELLSVKGIGEETADSILCYAVGAPVLVIDAYTRRLFRRLSPPEWSRQFREREPKYGEVQAFLMGRLKEENPFYNRFHALVVVHSKERCRKTPLCERCPMVGVCITGRERI
jgi:endonuclease-3 related protein